MRIWRKDGFFNTLSGRFFLLTVAFVLLAEVMIFVPSMARFRADFLLVRLKEAQIASLAQLAAPDMVSPALEAELLKNAEVFNVVLRRDQIRQLVLSSPIPSPIVATYDLRMAGPWTLIRDAALAFVQPESDVIRVIGYPVQDGGILIEVTLLSGPLKVAMIDYGLRILSLSVLISAVTALLLFTAVQRLMVQPINRVVRHMQAYAQAPEDARRVIDPTATVVELRVAEEALRAMQTQLTGALRQKERLAADPAVARAAPKLVNSISRAVNLCEATLAFGKAEEAPPRLARFALLPFLEDLVDGEGLTTAGRVTCLIQTSPGLMIRADSEQLYRILGNLIRNARQAIDQTGQDGMITLECGETDTDWWISVADTGPGLPPKAREHLFAAFQGGTRAGGTGLGLAIAAELVRGHGGRLDLMRSDAGGTDFVIRLPKTLGTVEAIG